MISYSKCGWSPVPPGQALCSASDILAVPMLWPFCFCADCMQLLQWDRRELGSHSLNLALKCFPLEVTRITSAHSSLAKTSHEMLPKC